MVDVTVMGAGIFGLSVAWACVGRGAKVRVIDPGGVGAGSSGGLVGALAPHTPENWNEKKAFQLDSLLMAESYWAEVEAVSGKPAGYGRTGRLQPIADARAEALAEARVAGAVQLWQGQAIWEVRARSDFDDWAPESSTGLLIHDTLSARLHPQQACAALAAALAARGVEIVTEGSQHGAVVWATGWQGLTALSEAEGRMIGNGVKGQAALLRLPQSLTDHAKRPQLYADALHIVPHADGTIAVGSTSEREFDAPKSVDDQLEAVIARARAALPVLAKAEVIARWAGVRPRAKSRAPMLGKWPGRPGHFIANGGFKIGFGMAPKVGVVMADLVLDGRDAIPEGFQASALF